MTEQLRELETELAIIGTGIAGGSAALFAREAGLSCLLAGNTGSLAYTTGYLDLLGATEELQPIADPWEGLTSLAATQPLHPLSRVDQADIQQAFTSLTTFLRTNGLGYNPPENSNIDALTPVGITKKTLCIPDTMSEGAKAFASKKNALIIDFKGLKGFSARQIVANLKEHWPNLASRRLTFPDGAHGELYPEMGARSLEVPQNRERFAQLLIEAAGDFKIIGMPAILGIHRPDAVRRDLERLTGLTIFEIPTMPPSVAGVRIRELFEQQLPKLGVELIAQRKVSKLVMDHNSAKLTLADNFGPIIVNARAVLLATGRFLSGGLESRITGITEPLLDLPVTQPDSREDWYQKEYLSQEGHSIHKSGIEIDNSFRPCGKDGKALHKNLFSAGTVLAHQDWVRNRCGAGLAISSAWKAVQSAKEYLSVHP